MTYYDLWRDKQKSRSFCYYVSTYQNSFGNESQFTNSFHGQNQHTFSAITLNKQAFKQKHEDLNLPENHLPNQLTFDTITSLLCQPYLINSWMKAILPNEGYLGNELARQGSYIRGRMLLAHSSARWIPAYPPRYNLLRRPRDTPGGRAFKPLYLQNFLATNFDTVTYGDQFYPLFGYC